MNSLSDDLNVVPATHHPLASGCYALASAMLRFGDERRDQIFVTRL
jgi:hypothetical protein